MNDKRSTIFGFALIGIILLVFSWYNTKQFNKRQQEALLRDSLATVAAIERGEVAGPAADTLAVETPEETNVQEDNYQGAFLSEASRAETAYYTLENDKIAVKISSKGAQPYEVW